MICYFATLGQVHGDLKSGVQFTCVWSLFMLIALISGGILVMRNGAGMFVGGMLMGLCAMMSQLQFTFTCMFGAWAHEYSTGATGAEGAVAFFSFVLFVVFAILFALLYRFRVEVFTGAVVSVTTLNLKHGAAPLKMRKGSIVLIKKDSPLVLQNLAVKLGWQTDLVVDASIVALSETGEILDTVMYNKTTDSATDGRMATHSGDIKKGGTGGDQEEIVVNLGAAPVNVAHLAVVVNVYTAGRTMDDAPGTYVRLVSTASEVEVARYTQPETTPIGTSGLLFCRFSRTPAGWNFATTAAPVNGSKASDAECVSDIRRVLGFGAGRV